MTRCSKTCSPACTPSTPRRPPRHHPPPAPLPRRGKNRHRPAPATRSSSSAFPTAPISPQSRRHSPMATSAASKSPAPSPPNPRLLLLDEPAAGMNPAETAALATLVRSHPPPDETPRSCSVEHDMGFVMGLSDSVTVLNFGRLHLPTVSPARGALRTRPSSKPISAHKLAAKLAQGARAGIRGACSALEIRGASAPSTSPAHERARHKRPRDRRAAASSSFTASTWSPPKPASPASSAPTAPAKPAPCARISGLHPPPRRQHQTSTASKSPA